ncbi:hypothetical protein AJ79_10127 [Helicocarpus griseus UAMH5409]|uniref:Uncharacterized protein n=1 Tax=Helicocarpus griseus UAMH5409 TaxID=1447875 RepID=A0A2B7WFS2_9EURO|nr:hypothetical protein AJ79_10127 [Helicocarpus griseus UAMH5409]
MAPKTTPARHNNSLGQTALSERNVSSSRPPRFVFGSNAPSSSASQFAATPRFRFSHKGDNVSDVDIDVSDAAPSSSAITEGNGWLGDSEHARPTRDVVQDSNSDEEELLFPDETTSSSLGKHSGDENPPRGLDVDAEMGGIFPPTSESRMAKRRRISLPPPKDANRDSISSCSSPSPSPSPSSPKLAASPVSPATPARQLAVSEPSTPLPPPNTAFKRPTSSSMKHPRFLLHNTSITPSQAQPVGAPTPTQRRQPHFILPSTPSRPPEPIGNQSTTNQAFAIPGRPGRATANAPNCIPGGMAASVRSWLLEAEAIKHASQFSSTQGPEASAATQPPLSGRAYNYYLIAEVADACFQTPGNNGHNTHAPGHPAPATLITTTTTSAPHSTSSGSNTIQSQCRKILLFGGPLSTPSRAHSRKTSDSRVGNRRQSASTSASVYTVKRGDRIGIRRGLVWEMEIEEFGRTGGRDLGASERAAETDGGNSEDVKLEKWTVGVEWDIIELGLG